MPSLFYKLIDLVFPPHKEVLAAKEINEEEILLLLSLKYSEKQNIYTGLPYKDKRVRALIKANKFHKDPHSAKILGSVLEEMLLYVLEENALSAPSEKPILIAMPSSRKRFLERDGNQVEWVIRNIEKDFLNSFSYPNSILCRKDRKSQTHVPRYKREENIKNAFYVPKNVMINHNNLIILVDDVSESGATMKDAIRALKEAGAKEVIGVALAK